MTLPTMLNDAVDAGDAGDTGDAVGVGLKAEGVRGRGGGKGGGNATMTVYAIYLGWPEGSTMQFDRILPSETGTAHTLITLVGAPTSDSAPLKYTYTAEGGLVVAVPSISYNKLPCPDNRAWTFKFTNVQSRDKV